MAGEIDELLRQCGGLDRSLARAPRDIERAFEAAQLGRTLVRGGLANAIEYIVIELVDRHEPVAVAIGLASLESLHNRGGEDRRLAGSRKLIAFK